MIKDSKGFIWVGTIDGLNRYDGYQFHVYHTNYLDTTSLSENFITSLHESAGGDIWVGTRNGINLYNPATDGFRRFQYSDTHRESIPDNYIRDIFEDEAGQLWVATFKGIARYDKASQSFRRVSLGEGIDSAQEASAFGATEGGFWIELGSVLYRYKNGRFEHFADLAIPESASDLYEDEAGKLWIGTPKGIFRFNPADKSLTRYHNGRTWDIYPMEGKVWFNLYLQGIHEWSPQQQAIIPVKTYLGGKEISGDIKAFFKDENGITWTTYHGLYKQDPYEDRFQCIRPEQGNSNSLIDQFVSGIAEDEDGNWVAASSNKGISFYDRRLQQWKNYKTHASFDNELVGQRVFMLRLFGDQAFLISQHALHSFDTRTGALKTYDSPDEHRHANASILQLDANRYLVSGNRLMLFDQPTGTFKDLTPEITAPDNPGYRLCRDANNRIWAVSSKALFIFNPQRQAFRTYAQIEMPFTSPGSALISFHCDSKGRLWMGRNTGLLVFDPENRALRHFSTLDGLPNNNINSILTDRKERLWMGTNNGLSCFDPDTETFRNYDRHDGLQDEIFLPNAAFEAPDGRLFFGGVNGFNIFHPDSIVRENPNPPRVLITDLKIFNQSVQPGPDGVLSKPIMDTREIELSYQHTVVSFELLALGYSQPEKNQYAYMMEGVDPDWNYVGTRHTASYSGLPRGKELTFKVKAANHDGVWSETPATLKIYVTPPFWETAWFKVLLLALLVGMLLVYYRWRMRNIKLRNRWLEEEVKKQTAEIQDQTASLSQANHELQQQAQIIREQMAQLDQLNKAQSRFFTGLSHEFRTPLTLLVGYLEELNAPNRLKDLNLITNRMQQSAKQLLGLINQLMDAAKMDSGFYKLQAAQGDLKNEVRKIFQSFQVMAGQKGLDYTLEDTGLSDKPCWFDHDVLCKVLNNLLSNAIKYTEQGAVHLEARTTEHPDGGKWVRLELTDTGIGISKDQLPFIFDRFYQAEEPMSPRKAGTGIGLSLVRQLIDLHKGQIEVESHKNKGSRFTVSLPVSEAMFNDEELSAHSEVAKQLSLSNNQSDTPPNSTLPQAVSSSDKEAPLVLIVEDNMEIRAFLSRQLRPHYNIVEAANGADGWEKTLEHIPDIIISDVIMPKLNGFELCDRVKTDQRSSHIPLVLLTALSEQEKKLQGLQHGADAYLSKPFNQQELQLILSNFLRHRNTLQEWFLKKYAPGHLPEGLAPIDQEFINRLNEYIEAHLDDEALGVAQLIQLLGVSRTQLFRKLKSITGMSATEYIRDYRLKKAYLLLQEGHQNVSEIIYATGFNSRSHFYESFRKKYGASPSELIDPKNH
jgi:signal transduction histidine kinase/ligand-binding sensor domain-containing protein/CheY-like chemotaxis protein